MSKQYILGRKSFPTKKQSKMKSSIIRLISYAIFILSFKTINSKSKYSLTIEILMTKNSGILATLLAAALGVYLNLRSSLIIRTFFN